MSPTFTFLTLNPISFETSPSMWDPNLIAEQINIPSGVLKHSCGCSSGSHTKRLFQRSPSICWNHAEFSALHPDWNQTSEILTSKTKTSHVVSVSYSKVNVRSNRPDFGGTWPSLPYRIFESQSWSLSTLIFAASKDRLHDFEHVLCTTEAPSLPVLPKCRYPVRNVCNYWTSGITRYGSARRYPNHVVTEEFQPISYNNVTVIIFERHVVCKIP
jgi:hypothetical protein